MTPSELSRRDWLRQVSVPAAGALALAGAPIMPATIPPSSASRGARIYDIRDYGAKGDGTTLDTAAVQKAIDSCNAEGGGTVLVPEGTFHVGALELKSNVTLYLVATGTLLGSADGKQYHAIDAIPLTGDSTLGDGNWALIYAVNAQNIGVDGPGLIDGQGIQFHSPTRGATPPSGIGGASRPYHILLYRCEHVRLRNVRLFRCAFHSVRIIQSKHVQIDGLHIFNRVNGNNDGFHFISCEHVAVSNCTVQSQDDACALFGSCRNITITNSYFSTRWSVFRFGGGTVENIAVSNCVLHQVYGCPIKLHGSPGSRFENMSFSNIILNDVTGPINISVGPRSGQTQSAAAPTPPQPPGIVRNISFSNIHGTVTTNPGPLPEYPFESGYRSGERHSCIVLNAVGGSVVENISFDDVHLTFGGGGTAEEGARRDVPEVAGEYFALGPMPAYALYARNVRGITMQNVRFQVATAELRPAVVFDRVEDVAVNGMSVEGNAQAESVLRFTGAKDVLLTAQRLLTAARTFLQLEGGDNARIKVDGGELSRAARAVAFEKGAMQDAVKVNV